MSIYAQAQVKLPEITSDVKAITEITYLINNGEKTEADTTAYYTYNKDGLILTADQKDNAWKYVYEYNDKKQIKKLTEIWTKENTPIRNTFYEYDKKDLLKTERTTSKWVVGTAIKKYYYNKSNQLIRIDEPLNNDICISTSFDYAETGKLKRRTETHKYNKNQNRTILYNKCGEPIYNDLGFIDSCSYEYEKDSIQIDIVNNENKTYKTFSNNTKKTVYVYDTGKLISAEKYIFDPISKENQAIEKNIYNNNGKLLFMYKSYYTSVCIHSKPNNIAYSNKYEYYDNGLLKRVCYSDGADILQKEIAYEITYWEK